MLIVWALVLGALAYIWYKNRPQKKAKKRSGDTLLANRGRITNLSSYTPVLKKYQKMLTVLVVTCVVSVVAGLLLSARPVQQSIVTPAQKNRDIMLCLDVSSSMYTSNADILKTFVELTDQFEGQRIGLIAFNSSAATIVPLTDDYTLIKDSLKRGASAFEALAGDNYYDLDYKSDARKDGNFMIDGTQVGSQGSSLAGDGLATCIQRLGSNEQGRAQSIILATDNDIVGTQIITLPEAAALAKEKGIRVYALDPGAILNGAGPAGSMGLSSEQAGEVKAELEGAVAMTGGRYFGLKEASVPVIISDISLQEAKLFAAPPELVRTDAPLLFVIIVLLGVAGVFGLAWRLRL